MNDHHTACSSLFAHSGCMIISWRWLSSHFFCLGPSQWRNCCVESPKVIGWPYTVIATKYDDVGLDVDHVMPMSSSWSLFNDWENHLMRRLLPIPSIKHVEIVWHQSSSTSGSFKEYQLFILDLGTSMCSSCSRPNSCGSKVQFPPGIRSHVEAISIIRDRLLTGGLSSSPTE